MVPRACTPGLLFAVALGGCDVVWGLEREPVPPPVAGEWASVASGAFHSCAIQTDGSLWCWGDNEYGRLGLDPGAELEVLRPQRVGDKTWTEIGAGFWHTCGIRDDGTLWCWGNNANGQLGDTTRVNRDVPTQVGDLRWKSLGVGDFTTCAIRDDDSLWCWGLNIVGQVGDGTVTERTAPTNVGGTRKWTSVSASTAHACAVTVEGEMWCWGTGPFGGPTSTMQGVPGLVESGHAWTAVATMIGTICGISGGQVLCWGSNDHGQLGDGTLTDRPAAAPVASGIGNFVRLGARVNTVCAISADGVMACWGENRRGQIGSDLAAPVQLTPFELDGTWRRGAPSLHHACAIDSSNHLFCTGGNGSGQRGDGTGGSVLRPVNIPGSWSWVSASEVHTCAIGLNRVSCWGGNERGQLGDGTVFSRQVPTQISSSNGTTWVAAGQRHSCSLTGGQVYCWGDNRQGQLGVPVSNGLLLPARVPGAVFGTAANPASMVDALEHTCVIGSDARTYCFGPNGRGQLGIGMVTAPSTPTAVIDTAGMPVAFQSVTVGQDFSCGSTGSATYCWGANASGQLGVGDTTTKLRATSIGSTSTSISAGASHACLIDNNELLKCWGDNTFGQLGTTTAGNEPSPVTVPSGRWRSVSAGANHTCAIRTDESLWCWGKNTRGALGSGTRESTNGPVVQVDASKWLSVSAGIDYTCGIQRGGTLWCWGASGYGQLGTGNSWISTFEQIELP